MRREGRVTGYVRRRSVDSRAAKEPYEEEELQEVIDRHDRIKLLNKATNESKDSSRCRRSGCRGCHACPTSKALAKTKGRNKPRCSWNSRGRNPLAHLDISLRNLCALKAQIDEYDADDNGEKSASECDEYKNVDDPKEHHITPVSENLSSMNGDSVYFRGERQNCKAHDAESASESLTDNFIEDFVLIDKYNMAQAHPNALPVSQKESPYICFHPCDSNGSAEWYEVADDSDDDEDDWHVIID